MTIAIQQDLRAKALADWQEAIEDKEALLKAPEPFTRRLIEQAKQAEADGVIDADDLRELLEWAGSAYEWAVEELITRDKQT